MDDFINLKKIQEKLALNNWSLYEYQKEFLKFQSQKKFRQILISSEIGTGKTITAFLPFFKNEINKTKKKVIYISPLKSINTTLKERLTELSLNLGIKCKIEKRTSDISYITKKKQLLHVPDIPKISNFELMALILLNVKANWSPLFEAINSFNSSIIK